MTSFPPPPAHIHLVGIGGVGLSAIARVLLEQGYQVSGSDRALNAYTEALARDGATIYAGHDAAHITDNPPDVVLISSAIKGNPEVEAAERLGIPVVKRKDIIASLMEGQTVIAVAGSHGKTTTTAMIAHILIEVGMEPGYIIGGTLKTTGTNAAAGAGNVFVIEADEYDYMFLGLRPNIAVVTNVEWDHPDFFKTPEEFQRAFEQFVDLLPNDGILVACDEDKGARELAAHFGQHHSRIVTYNHQTLEAERLINILQVPGAHNQLNATAAIIAVRRVGVSPHDSEAALATFTGVARRFDVLGERNGVVVIDDYAHNPTKIRSALAAARAHYPEHIIWAVWQPHTYTRTQIFLNQYATAFRDADHVLVLPIYAAREQPLPGVTADTTATAIQAAGHPDTRAVQSYDEALAILRHVSAPAVVVICSAGDANQIGMRLLKKNN